MTGNYNDASGTVNDTIAKADASVLVNGYSGTYDAAPHGATLDHATGVGSADLSSGINLGTSFTSVPGGTAHWTFSYPNYNDQSGDVAIDISKATASITVTPYSVTYDSLSHTATGTATGVLNETLTGLDLSATTHTNAGSYPIDTWTFTDVTSDYNNASGTVTDSIAKASLTITAVANTKVSDGTTSAAAIPTYQVNAEPANTLYGTDTLTNLSETYDTAAVGTGKTLTVSGSYTLTDGNSGGNYTVVLVADHTGVITAPANVYVDATWTGFSLGTVVYFPGDPVTQHSIGSDAFATVQGGANAVASGGIEYVAAGTYSEQVSITKSLTLSGAGSSIVTIQPPANVNSGDEVSIASGYSVSISGVTVKGGSQHGRHRRQRRRAHGHRRRGQRPHDRHPGPGRRQRHDHRQLGDRRHHRRSGRVAPAPPPSPAARSPATAPASWSARARATPAPSTATERQLLGRHRGRAEQPDEPDPVTATFDWWGSSTGPTSSGNPGGTGSGVIGSVNFSPWLGDARTSPVHPRLPRFPRALPAISTS